MKKQPGEEPEVPEEAPLADKSWPWLEHWARASRSLGVQTPIEAMRRVCEAVNTFERTSTELSRTMILLTRLLVLLTVLMIIAILKQVFRL